MYGLPGNDRLGVQFLSRTCLSSIGWSYIPGRSRYLSLDNYHLLWTGIHRGTLSLHLLFLCVCLCLSVCLSLSACGSLSVSVSDCLSVSLYCHSLPHSVVKDARWLICHLNSVSLCVCLCVCLSPPPPPPPLCVSAVD